MGKINKFWRHLVWQEKIKVYLLIILLFGFFLDSIIHVAPITSVWACNK
jgi:hypothetical protein